MTVFHPNGKKKRFNGLQFIVIYTIYVMLLFEMVSAGLEIPICNTTARKMYYYEIRLISSATLYHRKGPDQEAGSLYSIVLKTIRQG